MKRLLLIATLLFVPFVSAQETTATLSWQAPTERNNGEALPAEELDFYEIEVVTNTGREDVIAQPGTATSYVDTFQYPYGALEATYRLRVTDVYGLTSAWSDPVVYTAVVAPGSPPARPFLSVQGAQ